MWSSTVNYELERRCEDKCRKYWNTERPQTILGKTFFNTCVFLRFQD